MAEGRRYGLPPQLGQCLIEINFNPQYRCFSRLEEKLYRKISRGMPIISYNLSVVVRDHHLK